jgi:dienelactone hydrolase
VVIMHGGAASQEMYLWAAEGLAEAGYMVLTFSIGRTADSHYEDTKAALEFLTSPRNPRRGELDRNRIGLAGHSAGGVAVSRLGQEDRRVSAIASWDRAQSTAMPAGLRLRTPAIFFAADFNCQRVPVCLPQRYPTPPDPRGPGNKDQDFQRLRAAGVDTMKVALRAATHLDFTEFPQANGSRYGVVTAFYYTLAWFDRYLRGDRGAVRRLTASRFDGSADLHYISGGRFDPQTQQNVPARIAGQRVADRLSFHFRSACFLDGGRYRSEDLRAAGCPAGGVAGSGRRCLPRRLAVSARRIGPARLGRGYRAFFRRYRAVRRGRGATRFCVRGGGRFLVGAHRDRIDFVATTARRHRTRRFGPGSRVPRSGIRGARGVRRGLLVGHRAGGGRVLYGTRRRRVRFLAAVTRRQVARKRSLARRLRSVGL